MVEEDARADQNGEPNEQKLRRLLNSRRAHRGVATRLVNQAKAILSTPVEDLNPHNLKELKAFQKSISRKLADIEVKNAEVELLIAEEKLETDILESADNIAIIEASLDSIAEFIAAREKAVAPEQPSPLAPQIVVQAPQLQNNFAANVMKLPKLDLPKFSGDYKQWSSFYDLFKASVDTNNSLSDSQKLHYLKCSLDDDAAKLLSSLTITDNNYPTAKTILEGRFQNKRVIVRGHLQAIHLYPVLKQESSKLLRKLMETVNENRLALQNQGVELHDAVLVFLLTEKMDPESRRQWELSSTGTDLQTFDSLYKWLELRCRALESAPPEEPATSNNSIPMSNEKKKAAYSYHSTSDACALCQGEHRVHKCKKFTDMGLDEKYNCARKNNLCYKCLLPGHVVGSCPSKTNCKTCNKRHHSILHRVVPEYPNQCSAGNNNCSQVLLPTAVVRVKSADGQNVLKCRALLDSGSQMSFISNKTFQRLGVRKAPFRGSVATLGGVQSSSPRGSASVEIVIPGNVCVTADVCILPTVTQNLPQQPIDIGKWKIDRRLPLADPNFNVPKEIDILLGSDVYEELVLEKKIRVANGIFMRETVFGWAASGPGEQSSESPPIQSFPTMCQNDIGFDLRKFWETEEVNSSQPELTSEELACVKHFDETTFRNNHGRFVVSLPFRNNAKPLVNSRLQAEKRFSLLERRLNRNPDLKTQYADFIQEYLELKHLEIVPEHEVDRPDCDVYYLPHHCVIKDSTTTKLRVVFDASAATTNGVSLNDNLLVGPTVQSDLLEILIRFRFHKIAFSADIAKMYRQVLLSEKDKDYHRILWRFKPEEDVKVLRMRAVTYGIASSAYHSVRSVNECAALEHHELVTPIIHNDFYVDNALSGTCDLDKALEVQDKLIAILAQGGFDLRKWSSNAPELIYRLPPSHREMPQAYDLDIDSHTVKTLGVVWNPVEDSFTYTVQLPKPAQTIRGILSEISKIYDPLGWLSPVTVKLKCFMQKSWLLPMDWDSVLPESLQQEWDEMRNSLTAISNLVIERFVLCNGFDSMDLHVFCDASEVAYAAAVFVRCERSGTATCKLLAAKTKVSPIKKVSLPRLELCAAVLGARLLQSVQLSLSKLSPKVFPGVTAWSDSTIVLAWISQLPRTWNCYVGNRVSEIQSIIAPTNWRHVPGISNPADCASRGILAEQLRNNYLWWNGPDWLLQSPENWPQPPDISVSEAPERQKNVVNSTALTVQLVPPVIKLENFSSMTKLVRTFAYCLRFIEILRSGKSVPEQTNSYSISKQAGNDVPEPPQHDIGSLLEMSCAVPEQRPSILSPSDLMREENVLIGLEQKRYFAEEIKDLAENGLYAEQAVQSNPIF